MSSVNQSRFEVIGIQLCLKKKLKAGLQNVKNF